jgi:hypothetical protein
MCSRQTDGVYCSNNSVPTVYDFAPVDRLAYRTIIPGVPPREDSIGHLSALIAFDHQAKRHRHSAHTTTLACVYDAAESRRLPCMICMSARLHFSVYRGSKVLITSYSGLGLC